MNLKKIAERLRRDWFLILILLMLGVCFMLVAGERATQLVSDWSLRADMRSNLDPNSRFRSGPQPGNMEPLKPEILTPPVWNDTYLTPKPEEDVTETAVTMVVFDPSATPSVTPTSSPTASPTPSPTIEPNVTKTEPPPPTPTKRKKKEDDDDPPPPPPPSPSPSPPVTSTIDPALTEISPTPANLNVGPPDGSTANISSGYYVVVDITNGGSAPPITVEGPAETNYDLVYYEWDNGGNVMLDDVILGISQDTNGNPYYEVFNWGDNVRDENTNVDTDDLPTPPAPNPSCDTDPECDNRAIPTTELYDDDPAAPPAEPQTGILIDVDNAPSNPPPGDYDRVVIISPTTGNDPAQVDAVEQVDEPSPP